jgi:hypothetical protein
MMNDSDFIHMYASSLIQCAGISKGESQWLRDGSSEIVGDRWLHYRNSVAFSRRDKLC